MKITELANYNNPDSFGSRMRARRIVPLTKMIRKIHGEKGSVSILDVGGRETYWKTLDPGFLKDHSVKITILNLPSDLVGEESEFFTYAVGDACELSQYPDNAFDIVHSNSVIEHVGDWNRIKMYALEARRLAPCLFIQTPYFWFPIEPHFFKPFHHWLPKSLRVSIWMKFKMGEQRRAANIDQAMQSLDSEPYLLDMEMYRFLFPDCTILRERFLFLTKSMVAVRG
jgi:hypothetical protein